MSRMGDIYSQAARVIAWIGQNDYESRYGRAFLSELTSISAESSCLSGDTYQWQHVDKWRAVSSLCSRSYWSRLWIIQEVLLATDLRSSVSNVDRSLSNGKSSRMSFNTCSKLNRSFSALSFHCIVCSVQARDAAQATSNGGPCE